MIEKKITKIEVQKKRNNRCSIYLDDEFAFGVDQDSIIKFGLKKGDILTENKIEQILEFEEKRGAKERAFKFLAHRDRSEKEICDKLKIIGYKEEVIEWVVSELKRLNFIDDKRFATAFAKSKMISKPMGEFLLKRELLSKGIEEEVVLETLEKIYQEQDQYLIAKQLAVKQIQKNKQLEKNKVKKRVCDFLLRRGFNWEIINDVFDEIDFENN